MGSYSRDCPKGISARNLKCMRAFAAAWPHISWNRSSRRRRGIVEYAPRDTGKSICQLTRALPEGLSKRLPAVEVLEAELAGAEGC